MMISKTRLLTLSDLPQLGFHKKASFINSVVCPHIHVHVGLENRER